MARMCVPGLRQKPPPGTLGKSTGMRIGCKVVHELIHLELASLPKADATTPLQHIEPHRW
jgi:hypothetical protein